MENMFPSKETSADPLLSGIDFLVEKKAFSRKELQDHLMPVWQSLSEMDEAVPFCAPVNPKLRNKNEERKSMNLLTIRANLEKGVYTNPWEFCDDIWLMFDNAWLYRKNSEVYKFCSKLAECFMKAINPVMRDMGYCCGQKLTFTPLALFCDRQPMCVIGRDQEYYLYGPGSTQFDVTVSDKYICCLKCFKNLPEGGINLNENLNETPNMTPKSKFIKMKNDQIHHEPFESCKICKRKWHRICANFNEKVFPEGFICDTCRKEKNIPKPENKFTAKKLPHCQLSRHIEDRVNQYMIKKGGLSADQYEVVIRVLCAVDKEVEVKLMMKQKYAGFPDRFPYRSKAIFAYEVVDGAEICFFGLHVQEYGNDCPLPNRGRVYLAYLDSVHFFQPRQLRTDVYHEILLGYLEYVKNLGYTMAHIWACPPSEGDDYIFHCHPPKQKIPELKRLQDWYKKMLDKGIEESIVAEYKDIFKQSKDDNVQAPTSLPYFEGDLWPNIIEDCICKEENERRKQEAAQAKEGDEEMYQVDDEGEAKKSNRSLNNKKKNNLKKSTEKKPDGGTGDKVMDKLYIVLKKHKEVFFTVRLVSHQEIAMNKLIKDPDPLSLSELMDGRDNFLNKARDEHWEFSSLRRAMYSSLCFCYALHTQENISYICNNCNNTIVCWHYQTCDDFDLCASCYNTVEHQHKLEKINTIIEVSAESSNTRDESMQRCNQCLIHASQCRDTNCCRKTCHQMKEVVAHTKLCKKLQSNCPVCNQFIKLCCYHAKHCNQQSCTVPFCSKIRQKLQKQKRSQNRRADNLMRRRMDMLNADASNRAGLMYASTSSVSAIPQSNHPPPTMQTNFMHFRTNGNMGPSGMPNQGPMMGMNLIETRPMNDIADMNMSFMNNPPGHSSQDDLIEPLENNLIIQHFDADETAYQASQLHWPIGAPGQPDAPTLQGNPLQGHQAPQSHWQTSDSKQPGAPAPQNYPTHGDQTLDNNTRSANEIRFAQHVEILKSTFPIIKMNLEKYKDKIHANVANREEMENMSKILKEQCINDLNKVELSCLKFYFSTILSILIDHAEIWWNNIFSFAGKTHGGGAPIIRPNKLAGDISTIIPTLSSVYTNPPPEKRQKLQIIDEYLENTNDEYLKENSVGEYLENTQNRALLMTLDTEPMKLVIIDMNVQWYKLVPSALNYYAENEHPPVFVTFYATERSDSGFIFMIPAHVKTNEPNGKKRNDIVICSNIWATNHDNTRQKRQDLSESKSKGQKTPIHHHYECQSCAMLKKKGKGKQEIENAVETNDDEEMVEEDMPFLLEQAEENGQAEYNDQDEDYDQDYDDGYENEEEISNSAQNESKVISNKSTTFLLKSCKEQQFRIRIEEINERLEHKSCGEKFSPEFNNNLTEQEFKQQPNRPKGLPKDLVDAIYKTCIRKIRSKIQKGEDLIQNDDKLLVNGKYVGQEENESKLIPIAHVKALHICRKVLAYISTSTWKRLLFSEKFLNDFEKKVNALELYEKGNKMNDGEIKKPREQSLGQANIQFKTNALGCELLKDAMCEHFRKNNADIEFCVIEDVAYEITKILNFNIDVDSIDLDAQMKILTKMHNLGFPEYMNWNHVKEVLDQYKKRKRDMTKNNKKKSENIRRIIDWYRQKMAEDSMISIRKLLELEYMVDGENELNIVNIGGQEEVELPTSSKAKPKIYSVYYY